MKSKKSKTKTKTKKRNSRVGRGKPKGKPPAALRKPSPRAKAPAPREVGLLDAILEALSDVEGLGQEMRDWADGMPDALQGGSKYDEVNEAADTLEEQGGNDPIDMETMAFLNDVKVTIQDPTPRKRGYSRDARLSHARDILYAVVAGLLEYYIDKHTPEAGIAESLKDDVETIVSELEGVTFPGMFG